MQNITTIAELKDAIQILEVEQTVKWQLLKEQFHVTYESLKPVNLLKSTFTDIATSPFLIENILGNVVGLATGYLSKKIFVSFSGNIFRKLFGSVLQVSVKNIVAQHPDAIKAFGQFIIQHFLHKKEMNSKNHD
jgi:hypothetical protein